MSTFLPCTRSARAVRPLPEPRLLPREGGGQVRPPGEGERRRQPGRSQRRPRLRPIGQSSSQSRAKPSDSRTPAPPERDPGK